MARSVPWRRVNSDACSWHQDQALDTTILIMRQTGPTGFLLKEEGEAKCFKVFLGDVHSCTCPTFKKEKDLCKHVCWILLRKFRVPRQNPMTWQLGLVEREINEILRGIAATQGIRPTPNARNLVSDVAKEGEEKTANGTVAQREITEEDVCPICQEDLLGKHLPVTYCKFGCGNSVHIKCMGVWANHQRSTNPTDASIKCPMCREDFGPYSLLQKELSTSHHETMADRKKEHLGIKCSGCQVCPVVGKCYKCVQCTEYYFCQACFNSPDHNQHAFSFRERPNQRWRPAPRTNSGALPEAVAQQLMSRELCDQDYDLLLQLDSNGRQSLSDLTEATIRSFRMEVIRHNGVLLTPGNQCRICLRGYQVGQQVRQLPCRHKFHKDCIDNRLLHQHATCPVDGTLFTNESVRNMRESSRTRRNRETAEEPSRVPSNQHRALPEPGVNLEIPGIGIARLTLTEPSQEATSSQSRTSSNLRRVRSRQQILESALESLRANNQNSLQGEVTGTAVANGNQLPRRSSAADLEAASVASFESATEMVPASNSIRGDSANLLIRTGDVRNTSAPFPHRMKPPSGSRSRRHQGQVIIGSTQPKLPQRTSGQTSRQLFVGHDPSSTAGFTSQFSTFGAPVRRPAPLRSHGSQSDQSAADVYRWGNQHEMDMTLSGNAVNAAPVHDNCGL